MISDSITNASSTATPNSKDFRKKKSNNKSAKMKQNKLGLRREQWLSQVAVTNKVCKEERSVNRSEKPDLRDNPVENLDGLCREEDKIGVNLHHESFMQSPSNSSMGGTDLSTNFSGRSSRSSSSNSGFFSGNIIKEENLDDDDDGCVRLGSCCRCVSEIVSFKNGIEEGIVSLVSDNEEGMFSFMSRVIYHGFY